MKDYLKDFFFFYEQDKKAIIILLALILLIGIYSIYTISFSKITPEYLIQQEELNKEFSSYEDALEDKVLIDESNSIIEASTEEQKKTQNPSSTGKLTNGQVIDLNKANVTDLKRIPGIGNTLAQRIVEERTKIGGFENTEQLLRIKGITNKKLLQIVPYITIHQ